MNARMIVRAHIKQWMTHLAIDVMTVEIYQFYHGTIEIFFSLPLLPVLHSIARPPLDSCDAAERFSTVVSVFPANMNINLMKINKLTNVIKKNASC